MGFYEGLNEEKYDRQYKDNVLTRRIAQYFTAQRRRVAIIIFLVVTMAVISAAQPIVVSRVSAAAEVPPARSLRLFMR